MATILVLSFSPLRSDPRVNRQIRSLAPFYTVVSCGYGSEPQGVTEHLQIYPKARTPFVRALSALQLKLGMTEQFYWSHPRIRALLKALAGRAFDLVLANDFEALPVGIKLAEGAPVLFDAHEYAPLEFEDRPAWRFFIAPYRDRMCKKYLPRAAAVTTVCQGIAERYRDEYGVHVEIIANAGPFHDLPLRPTLPSRIRLIHHGVAIASRRIEGMIDMMGLVDERFSLDLILVPGDPLYITRLRQRADGKPRIRFLDSVPMDKIVELSAGYDVGLFLLPPTNFNYAMALPNKLFEFIQARLAVAIGPSPEMARIVREFDCGIVADDFAPATLARALNSLTGADVDRMKAGSEKAAYAYTAENNAEKVREIVKSVLKEF